MINKVVNDALCDIRREGKIPVAIYMNSVEYKNMCKWIKQRYTLVNTYDSMSKETIRYHTPRYLNIPIITDEQVPAEEIWLKHVWPSMLETEVLEIE